MCSVAYLLNVRAAISAMSVPVGPHGSFEVAGTCQHAACGCAGASERTISNFDLDAAVALCDILDTSHDFRHAGPSSTGYFCDCVSSAGVAD